MPCLLLKLLLFAVVPLLFLNSQEAPTGLKVVSLMGLGMKKSRVCRWAELQRQEAEGGLPPHGPSTVSLTWRLSAGLVLLSHQCLCGVTLFP